MTHALTVAQIHNDTNKTHVKITEKSVTKIRQCGKLAPFIATHKLMKMD